MRACRCFCHHATTANKNDQQQRGNPRGVRYFATEPDAAIPPFVELDNQLESLVASGCSCSGHHQRLKTFLTSAPKAPPPYLLLPPPNPFDPYGPTQADGDDTDD